MSFYQRPIQPYDPVVPDQQQKPPIRYIRDNFAGTGQNSHVQPPTQDPAFWMALTNVLPINRGVIERRWGFGPFATVSPAINRLYNFQSDSLGTRALIGASLASVTALNETGGVYRSNVFTPVAISGTMRSTTSRNYQYFCDGNNTLVSHRTGDSLKWDGSVMGGVTNFGIVNADVTQTNIGGGGTASNVVGPNTGTTAANVAGPNNIAWTNPSGAFTNVLGSAASNFQTWNGAGLSKASDFLQATGFFTSISGPGIAGIQATVSVNTTATGTGAVPAWGLTAQLLKNGIPTGVPKSDGIISPFNGSQTIVHTFGGPSDLWGASLTPADLIQSTFGIQISISGSVFPNTNTTWTFKVPYITLTATLTGTAGGASGSGTGVGVTGGVGGGAVNLTLGRTYYLVPNNSASGHFGDLSDASNSTLSTAGTEFNLLLSKYNDPQVDEKYLLATADGGDPSILYEVNALVPGLTISSWVINGSNQVTFTGIYTGTQFAVGQTTIIGGLNTGSFMNGQTLTVTASTATTFTAAFTHGALSATEVGIAGYNTFAIPNSVTYVVDNTAEIDLLLNQPLLFTDQFGNEFGVTNNTPPPAGSLLIKHQGRMWMAGISGATHSVYFTKSVDELTLPDGFIAGKYEEAWPASNYFDVSDGAESVNGMLSDGSTLYIGTQNHIRRLIGNDPTNFTQPQIVHPNVGLLNQETWQLVFTQGSPAGSIWLTPDFRVIQSDFNTYIDIGHPIQDILNSLQSTAQTLAHATFVADGEFDLLILAVPFAQSTYCDLHLVYDMRNQHWFVWQPTGGSTALFYNVTATGLPQWLFADSTGLNIFQYQPNLTTDNGTPFVATAQTSWLSLGEPGQRKILNEVDYDGDPANKLSIDGALVHSDFSSPISMASNLASAVGPLGTQKYFVAAKGIKSRYYRFTFTSSSTTPVMLGAYNIETIPVSDL